MAYNGAWEDKNGSFDREEEKRVLYAALDSFRYVLNFLLIPNHCPGLY